MDVRPVCAVLLLASSGGMAVPAYAAPFVPVGSGVWGPSPNVGQSADCKGLATGVGDCTIFARSKFTGPPPANRTVETCTNVTYVVTTPVVIGTNFGCTVEFSAAVHLTGSGTEVSTEDPVVAIEAGACAGITLVGPAVTVVDGAAGAYTVPVRVTVTNAGWKLQGSYVALDTATSKVVVLGVTATVAPGCAAVRVNDAPVAVTFHGAFAGSYQLL